MKTIHRTIICVDLDWGSSGIWIFNKDRNSWANWNYEALALPEWLVFRFRFWTDWYNRKVPEDYRMFDDEEEMFNAYQLALAIDLRRHLDTTKPGEFEVRSGRKRVVELPDDAKDPPLGPYF